jgi:hypothetical protein
MHLRQPSLHSASLQIPKSQAAYPKMLVPRRVSKKRPDSAVAAKRRKIEDKERPFRLLKEAPSPPQVVPISEKEESDPESLIWANLVYLHLWSWILHEDTLTLTCRPKSQCELQLV